MYRQATLYNLHKPGPDGHAEALATAYKSLFAGWWNYWTQHNQGRPIIFLGHSQGSLMLIRLLSDPKSHAQERMVSVIIPGGNVIAPRGKDVGGSFQHIPACRSTGQAGCVIAYSSYPEPPPPSLPGGSKFGRTSRTGMQVLCTNPASLQGGSATLAPDFRESPHPGKPPSAPWTEYPDLFRAQCMSALGATWLSVSKISQNDHRRQLHQTGGRDWGYHVYDINLVLGNLVQDVKAQEVTYCKTDHQGCGKSTATARSYRLAAVASRRSVGPGRASRAQRAVGARRDRGQ
jgi:hypothetical protein